MLVLFLLLLPASELRSEYVREPNAYVFIFSISTLHGGNERSRITGSKISKIPARNCLLSKNFHQRHIFISSYPLTKKKIFGALNLPSMSTENNELAAASFTTAVTCDPGQFSNLLSFILMNRVSVHYLHTQQIINYIFR